MGGAIFKYKTELSDLKWEVQRQKKKAQDLEEEVKSIKKWRYKEVLPEMLKTLSTTEHLKLDLHKLREHFEAQLQQLKTVLEDDLEKHGEETADRIVAMERRCRLLGESAGEAKSLIDALERRIDTQGGELFLIQERLGMLHDVASSEQESDAGGSENFDNWWSDLDGFDIEEARG